MESDDIASVVAGFGASAALAREAGLDGVEVNAGQHSLIRQFLSGLTNHRSDAWGEDRLRFAREVLAAVRGALGAEHILGLRLSCDELAPWAGITPDHALDIAAALAEQIDYIVVVRGGIYSAEKTRPDFHEPTGFNIEVCRAVRARVPPRVAVFLQGSVIEPAQAEWAIGDGVCDGVEMTRAQIADPDLGVKLAVGTAEQIRPCLRCNQTCQVRDVRNPIVTCVGEPTSGHETEDPAWYAPATRARAILVVGAGPAGLETARVAAVRGHHVRVVERTEQAGGLVAVAGSGAPLVSWLLAEIARLDVPVQLGATSWSAAPDEVIVQCTGSRRGNPTYELMDGATVLDVADLRRHPELLPEAGDVALIDPIGGPIAVALGEELGERAILVTQDNVAGNELSRTGDLAPANVRLQQRGVRVERRTLVRAVRPGVAGGMHADVEVEDRFSGVRRIIVCAAVVDCGFRLPDPPLPGAHLRAGDCVAPRTVHEAVLEGRRAAIAVDQI